MSRLDKKTQKKIMDMFREKGSIRATAKLVGVSRNAVRRQLRGERKIAKKASKKPSKLDAYKAKICHLVKEKHLSAVRVKEEIKALGYDVHKIGDCLEPRNAKAAIYEGAVVGRKI